MKNNRHDYVPSHIINEWRKDKEFGYAIRIGKKFGIPSKIVHNVIYWHRRKKAEIDKKYRERKETTATRKTKKIRLTSTLQPHVVYVGASYTYSSNMIIV